MGSPPWRIIPVASATGKPLPEPGAIDSCRADAAGRFAHPRPEDPLVPDAHHAALIDAYLAGPADIRKAVAGLSPDQLRARPVEGRWSTLEVIAHLADSEQAWAHRLKRVIAEDRPLLVGYDETGFAAALAYHDRDPADELDQIDLIRRQMGRILRALPASAWDREGEHTERGPVTLRQMVEIEVGHVAHHLRFVAEKRRALGLAEGG